MIRGLYTAVSGLITQEAKMDVITNNMANINTNAFKGDDLKVKKFADVLVQSYDRQKGPNSARVNIGSLSQGSRIDETDTSYEQGILQDTGTQTDFALDGRGFFTVLRDNGTATQKYYTRDGHFHVNAKGLLVNDAGDSVLDTQGNTINVGNDKFACDASGNIKVGNNNLAKLSVVDFNTTQSVKTAYSNLIKDGDNLYRTSVAPETSTAGVKQNSLEKSNVNITSQMVDMMTTMRTFETNQKIVQAFDQTLGKAVNEVGTVR